MNKNNLKKYAYLAGLIDGDGCIVISKSYTYGKNHPEIKYDKYILKIEVSSSDTRLINYLVGAFGGRFGISNRKSGFSSEPNFFWQVYAKQNKEILKKIIPFIHLKKAQAELGVRFCEIHKGWEKKWHYALNGKRYTDKEKNILNELWLQMKKLNQMKIRDLSIVHPQRLSKETANDSGCDSPILKETLDNHGMVSVN